MKKVILYLDGATIYTKDEERITALTPTELEKLEEVEEKEDHKTILLLAGQGYSAEDLVKLRNAGLI